MRVTEREPGDAAELYRRARSERNALQRDRYRAVLLALEGGEAADIGKALGRARRSVQDWVYAYRATAGSRTFDPSRGPGVRPSCRAIARRN
jgi:transposase